MSLNARIKITPNRLRGRQDREARSCGIFSRLQLACDSEKKFLLIILRLNVIPQKFMSGNPHAIFLY